MTIKEMFHLFDEIILLIGERAFLDDLFNELYNTLSSDELEEYLKHIAASHGLSELEETNHDQ